MAGNLLSQVCDLSRFFREPGGARSDRISDVDILTAEIGLLVQGRVHYEDIELYRQGSGSGFAEALSLDTVPAESTLRTRLEGLARLETMRKLEGVTLALLRKHPPTPIDVEGILYIPLDIDVTPLDNTGSHREYVGRTYKGTDGFAPIMANLGREGFLLHHELRPGSQHCQKGTPAFLKRTFELVAKLKLDHPVMVRMDAGNDSADTIQALRDSGHSFIVKRNQRRDAPDRWLSHAMSQSQPECPREGKKVYTGTLEHDRPGGVKSTQQPLTSVYCVTERSIDKHFQYLLVPTVAVETYWTNLGHTPEVVIGLYHDHGTSEQFHSELKSDMNIERMPSHDFATNQLFFALGAIAYNLLRAIDWHAMKNMEQWPPHLRKKAARNRQQRRRVGSIMRDLVLIAGKLVSHAGRQIMRIADGWPWSKVVLAIDRQLA